MINTVRYSLLTSGILLSSMALAAPAGDLPLMPWPAHVERPQAQGALALNNQLTINVSGDDLGEAANRWRERVARQSGHSEIPQREGAGGQPRATGVLQPAPGDVTRKTSPADGRLG